MVSEMCLLVGLLAVASNPSPYYAALGLVWAAGAGCFVLVKGGTSFLSLVLFLIYLGGMMVVFAYCSALVAEPYPEAWGSNIVLYYMWAYGFIITIGYMMWGKTLLSFSGVSMVGMFMLEWFGVSELLNCGGWLLFLGVWSLLLTLFVVLEVVRGWKKGALRAV